MLVILKFVWTPRSSEVKLSVEPATAEQPTERTANTNAPDIKQTSVSTAPPTTSSTVIPVPVIDRKKADDYFRQGELFYKNGNLKKAIGFFETASQYPDHPYASDYLEKAREKLNKKVDHLITEAKRAEKIVKYDRAKFLLKEVIALLSDKPQDKRYSEAQNRLRKLESR